MYKEQSKFCYNYFLEKFFDPRFERRDEEQDKSFYRNYRYFSFPLNLFLVHHFNYKYRFLQDLRKNEAEELEKQVKVTEDPTEVKKIKKEINRLVRISLCPFSVHLYLICFAGKQKPSVR